MRHILLRGEKMAGRKKIQPIKHNQNRSEANSFMLYFAKSVFWILLTFLTYLGYLIELRKSLINNYGLYSVGFVDGTIAVTSLVAFSVYGIYLIKW